MYSANGRYIEGVPIEFRPSVPGDLPGIGELMRSAFGSAADAPYLNPELLRWKYFEAAKSYVMERDGRILAHGCAWPVPELPAICLIDWASSKDVPGIGILLARKICQTAPVTLSIGGSDMTQQIMPKIGFVKKGELLTYARVLRPWKQYRTRPRRGVKALLQLFRNAFWSLDPLPPPGLGSFLLNRVGGQCRIVSIEGSYGAAVETAFKDPEACELIALAHNGARRRALEAAGFRERARRSVFVHDPGGVIPMEAYPLPLDMRADDMAYMNVPEYPYLT